jgi:AraC family L-rhamnose operon regulatory protein RhaS
MSEARNEVDSGPLARLRRRPVDVRMPAHGVFVLESHHGPGFTMAVSCHDFLEVFYVLRGSGRFTVAGESHKCAAGDVVVVPVGAHHRVEDDPDEPLSLYGMGVSPEVWRTEPDLLDRVPGGRLALSGVASERVRSDLRRLLYEQTLARPGSRAVIVGLTLQLLALLSRAGAREGGSPCAAWRAAGSGHREAVERYAAELAQRFFEAADLESVASGLGMSRRRFTQLFREVTGSSWADHLGSLRVGHAVRLLRETDRSIVAIAFESGYEDLSSFYRAFKRQTGLPPDRWRRKQRGE